MVSCSRIIWITNSSDHWKVKTANLLHTKSLPNPHAPFATKRTNTNISPWLTVELKNKMNYRDVLQRKFGTSKTTEKYKKYKCQRNKVNNLIKRAKQNYNKNLLDENTKNATSFWRTLKSIFPTKPKSKLVSTTFKVKEEEISNKETIATGFGQFFSSIATTLLQTLNPIYKGLCME